MPSDPSLRSGQAERTSRALAATAELRARYRGAVAAAAEQIGAYLDACRARSGDVAEGALTELGAFARGRIDAGRLAAVIGGRRAVAPEMAGLAERAEAVLRELLARGDALFTYDLPSGGDLRHAVHDALEEAGRAFGAALVFQAVKTGVYRAEQHEGLLDTFPFARWNRTERLLAPPLVVSLDGADLHADTLAEFLDGQQKIVLVVRGPATPAPLVRLLTPGVFVAQTQDAAELARAAAFAGPAVAALVPEAAARFVHDPGAGRTLGERLAVAWLPPDVPRAPVGGRSVAQQREELAQLAALAELAAAPVAAPPPPAAVMPTPPVDEAAVNDLTTWLLAQAGFTAGSPPP
jgi:hypothetical protein